MTTPDILTRFQQSRRWNSAEMARQLGVSADRLRRMKAGEVPIRRTIRLALAALAYNLPEYGWIEEE